MQFITLSVRLRVEHDGCGRQRVARVRLWQLRLIEQVNIARLLRLKLLNSKIAIHKQFYVHNNLQRNQSM